MEFDDSDSDTDDNADVDASSVNKTKSNDLSSPRATLWIAKTRRPVVISVRPEQASSQAACMAAAAAMAAERTSGHVHFLLTPAEHGSLAWVQQELRRQDVRAQRLATLIDGDGSGISTFKEFQVGMQKVDIFLGRQQYRRLMQVRPPLPASARPPPRSQISNMERTNRPAPLPDRLSVVCHARLPPRASAPLSPAAVYRLHV